MENVDWEVLADLFQKALDTPASKRKAFIDEACADNTALKAELQSLLTNFEEAPDFFNSLGDVVPGLQPNDNGNIDPYQFIGTQIKQYRITELIGTGGMGLVYRAQDVELNRHVALKFLPPELSNDTHARERFITEARAASQLDHPNICTIYQIDRTPNGRIFIAMAFYEGETLKAKLKRGEVTPEDAIDYAMQICRGLDKAHEASIVHRDIKPANLMVTNDGVIKILDFGLAKIADQQLTRSGHTMGTAAYMSPEQARGDKVDHRTDIWSVGVLLYEMLAGERPFKGSNPQSVIYNIINEEPSTPAQHAIAPLGLQNVINKSLSKPLAKRYASVATLIRDIELAVHFPVVEQTKTRVEKRRPLAGVLVALGLLVAVTSFWFMTGKETPNPATANPTTANNARGMQIALLPFEVSPQDDEQSAALAAGLMRMITELLPKLDTPETPIWVASMSDVAEAGIETASMAADFLGANRTIEGSFQHLESVVALTLKLIDPQSTALVGTETSLLKAESITAQRLGAAFHEQLFESLTKLLGIQLTPQQQQAIQRVAPRDPDAYSYYLQGLGYLERYDKAGYIDYAIQQFNRSIQADSMYAPAHAGLCEATWEKYFNNSDQPALAEQASASCERAGTLAPDNASVLVHRASVFVRANQLDMAFETLEEALELEPDNAEAYMWLGRAHEHNFQPEAARAAYFRAIDLKPNFWNYRNQLGIFLSYSGDQEGALTQFQHLGELTPDSYVANSSIGTVLTLLNRPDEAEAAFLKAIEQRPNANIPRRMLGVLYYTRQNYQAAVDVQSAIEQNGDWISSSFLAHAFHWNGQQQQADSTWQQVINITQSLLDVAPNNIYAQLWQADAHAALGNNTEATGLIASLYDTEFDDSWGEYYIARIQEVLGNRNRALYRVE
ncbi:MAG: protein kinase, partial [Bacteroidota bacterium]